MFRNEKVFFTIIKQTGERYKTASIVEDQSRTDQNSFKSFSKSLRAFISTASKPSVLFI